MRFFSSALISLVLLSLHVEGQERSVAGQWKWDGPDANQQILLDLRAEKGKVSGTISMGRYVMTSRPAKRRQDMAVFKLRDVKIEGNTISFEQLVHDQFSKNRAILYRGTVNGAEMTLTRVVRDLVLVRADTPSTTFTLRRVQ